MEGQIKRVPLQHEIINCIREYIEKHELKPGDKLPSQAALIEMLGVSRTALREAIKTLEAKDVLEAKNGKGIYVKENYLSGLAKQIKFSKEKDTLIELLEVRGILEKEIIKRVIQNATDEEIEELGAILSVLMDKYNHNEKQNKEDKAFHYKIYSMSHHQTIQSLVTFLSESMDELWEFPLNMESPFIDTIPLHADLFEAIKERNVKKAKEINNQILNMMLKELHEQK